MARRVFLDACVLYTPVVRSVLFGAASAGLFTPRWSPRVLAEWRIAAARNLGIRGEDVADAAISEMERRFPDAAVVPDTRTEALLDLPDPTDAHVLAGAIAAGVEILLTFNLHDFPTRRLAAHDIRARHPDSFLWELFGEDPEAMDGAIRGATAAAGAETADDMRRALKRAKLPRLARAWSASLGRPG